MPAPAVQTLPGALPAAPAAALASAPVTVAQSVTPAQPSVAVQRAKVAVQAAGGARVAARAPASVHGNPTGLDREPDSDAIAPAGFEPAAVASAAVVSKPAPGPVAAAPAGGTPQPAPPPASGAAHGGQQANGEAPPPSSRPAKPGSLNVFDVAATASPAQAVTDAGAASGGAQVAAQPETAASVASIGPAQPAAASPDLAAAQKGAQTGAPAVQLAQAVTSLHAGADGSSHVTIKLDPAELGQVQVRITRAQDGTASVTVAVERPETLASLQGDLGHLHAALDRAGLPEQRSVTLHLGGSDQAGGQTLNAGAGGMAQGGFQQGARQERQPSSSFLPDFSAGSPIVPEAGETALPSRQTPMSGVNITA